MSSGLAALLDDVAAIAKLAAASIDDVGLAAGKASAKAAGVVIDDTAVTPTYVAGLHPDRELPIIGRIAFGSLRNKLLILLPGALLLSAFAPWAITPLLMLGAAFLCFEGAEKLIEFAHGDEREEEAVVGDPAHIEAERIGGAIRTDLILSAEIMAIALADIAAQPFLTQASALVVVSVAVTAGVYGAVALIVKMDDIGLYMAKRNNGATVKLGRMLVRGMPRLLAALSTIGMLAMLWVGGGIIVHGLEHYHVPFLPGAIHAVAEAAGHAVPAAGGVVHWVVNATLSAVVGLVIGAIVAAAVHKVQKLRR
jgi:predicted DNA repair protein MutK